MGGKGVTVDGDVSLTAGTVLDIVVGGQGTGTIYGGGGGGSFVYVDGASSPLLVAGGGGGGGGGSYVDSSFIDFSLNHASNSGNGLVTITPLTTVPAPASAAGISVLLAGMAGLRFSRRRRATA